VNVINWLSPFGSVESGHRLSVIGAMTTSLDRHLDGCIDSPTAEGHGQRESGVLLVSRDRLSRRRWPPEKVKRAGGRRWLITISFTLTARSIPLEKITIINVAPELDPQLIKLNA